MLHIVLCDPISIIQLFLPANLFEVFLFPVWRNTYQPMLVLMFQKLQYFLLYKLDNQT